MFSLADLTGANFDGAQLKNCDLTLGNLTKVSAPNSTWELCGFERGNLTEAMFEGARMTYCDLQNSNVSMASFANAGFKACVLVGLTEEKTVWDGATFELSQKVDLPRKKAEDWMSPNK
jgi:uncharacterized protein YjbI with pentapeptide repeats